MLLSIVYTGHEVATRRDPFEASIGLAGHQYGSYYGSISPGGSPKTGLIKLMKDSCPDVFSKKSGSKTKVFGFYRGSWRV